MSPTVRPVVDGCEVWAKTVVFVALLVMTVAMRWSERAAARMRSKCFAA